MEKSIDALNHPARSASHARTLTADPNIDQAYLFLEKTCADNVTVQDIDMARLRRKIDWRIVPIMFLCYTMNFIDKVALNYAAVMGLGKDLHLQGNAFSNTATAFFAAYLVAEIPTAFIINKVPVAKWFGINVILWGIATACTAAAKDYSSLLAARIFLGIFEAPVAPCLMLILSQWYTKPEQASRSGYWVCGVGAGQIVGGLLSFAFQHVESPRFESWRIMFVVLGGITVLLGVAAVLSLPASPMKARFLSDAEKRAVVQRVAENQTGIVNRSFNATQIREALADPQLWLLALMTILSSIPGTVVNTYSATLIRNFGYSPRRAALLNCPSGVVSIAASLIAGYGVRHTSHRWAWFVACCIPGIVGGALISFLPATAKPGLLTGIYLVNAVIPLITIIYQLTAANVAGHTKRAFSMTVIAAAFGIGNIIGPQTFQAHDAPAYIPAKVTVLVTQVAAALLATALFVYYRWVNASRLRQMSADTVVSERDKVAWENRTDKQMRSFVYVY